MKEDHRDDEPGDPGMGRGRVWGEGEEYQRYRAAANLIPCADGSLELRCRRHDHMVGKVVAPGVLEIKCRDDFVLIHKEVLLATH